MFKYLSVPTRRGAVQRREGSRDQNDNGSKQKTKGSMVVSTSSFAKTICSICYEDLKPIVEDLQAISICGHVFHELCLQQWFEYSSSSKKCSCPVCKQNCSANSASRLYFQSIGDQNESLASQKEVGFTEVPELLREEVKRLEVKVSGLGAVLERQLKEMKRLNEELDSSREQLKKEVALRTDALEEKSSIQRLFLAKSKELDTVKLQCSRLEDRNMALAKELAALKLVSDLNLDEDEALKLASFGNDANGKDTVDVLRKSLVIRNKSYKELMAKCNQLGRGEARSCKKLEKAKEKIYKLKTRVQELEMVVEVKENEALRALKASKKIDRKGVVLDCTNGKSNDKEEQNSLCGVSMDQSISLANDQENFNFINDTVTNSVKECNIKPPNKHREADLAKYVAASELSTAVLVLSDNESPHSSTKNEKSTLAKIQTDIHFNREAKEYGLASPGGIFSSRTSINRGKGDTLAAAVNEEVNSVVDDIRQAQTTLNIKKEFSSPVPLFKPGDICFSGGLRGPDGANRYLGKWCKRSQNKGLAALQRTSTSSGDLIAVGSDGRGGTVKVLRSPREFLLEGKDNFVATKRCKYGAKTSNLQSQGCLQIEHFFGRATN